MNRKSSLQAVCIGLFATLLFLISCRKIFVESNEIGEDQTSFTVKDARSYFYKVYRKEKSNLGLTRGKDNRIYPYWKFAYQGKTDKYDFIEVPIYQNSRPRYTLVARSQSKSLDKNAYTKMVNGSLHRLVLYKNKKGKIGRRVITYIPDADYLKAHNGDISHNQINKLDKDFSGYLRYTTIQGKYLFTLQIKEGKAIRKLKGKRPDQSLVKSTNKVTDKQAAPVLARGDQICDIIHWTEWETDCIITAPDGPDGPRGEDCGDPYIVAEWDEVLGCHLDCSDPSNFNEAECGGTDDPDPDPDPEEEAPLVDCAGVTYGTAYIAECGCIGGTTGIVACPPKDPLVNHFCDEMSTTQKQTINTLIEGLKTYDCASKYIYTRFETANKSFGFCIQSFNGNASYDPTTKSFNFATDYSATRVDIMEHEFFHAFQDDVYPGGTKQYARVNGVATPGFVNIEFEQAVITDMLHGNYTAFDSSNATNAQKVAYRDWIKEITNDYTSYPKLTPSGTSSQVAAYNAFMTSYNNFLSDFNSLPGNVYNSPILNLSPKALIQLFNNINPNCP